MERQQLSPPADPPETAPVKKKKKRTHPGISYPDAEVIAMSPKSLMATNRFICEVCKKGFQREQNLQLHRRGHNLPWKLRQKSSSSTKQVSKRRVYLCPEPTCVHHHPSRALGDLTGIKKHFSRKHGEKKWNCDKCDKRYAVLSDWKAHSKTCGTRDYRCDCGTLFSRRDSFISHRAFCGVLLPQETGSRVPSCHLYGSNSGTGGSDNLLPNFPPSRFLFDGSNQDSFPSLMQHRIPDFHVSKDMQFDQHHMIASDKNTADYNNIYNNQNDSFVFEQFSAGNNIGVNTNSDSFNIGSFYNNNQSASLLPQMSATALLQKAAEMGATTNGNRCVFENITGSPIQHEPMMDNEAHLQGLINSLATGNIAGMFGQDVQNAGGRNVHATDHDAGVLTRDFLGVEREPDPTKFTQQIPYDGAYFQ